MSQLGWVRLVSIGMVALMFNLPFPFHTVRGEGIATHSHEPPGTSPKISLRSPTHALAGTQSYKNVLVDAPCDTSNQSEVEQAVDPVTGYLYEAWIGCGGIGYSRSTDGGLTFGSAIAILGSAGAWDPAVAVSSNGTLYVAYIATSYSPTVAVSLDHGASFSYEQVAFQENFTEFGDRDFIAVAPNGTVYLTWNFAPFRSLVGIGCAPAGSCYYTTGDFNMDSIHSKDMGKTWSSPVPIDPEYPYGGALGGPLVVQPNGQVDVLYEDYNTTANHYLGSEGADYFSYSTNGGATWSKPIEVGQRSLANDTWWIAADLSQDASGTLYAVYDTQNTSTGDVTWLCSSRDSGHTWSKPTQISPDTDHSPHIASVAGGEAGKAYVAWSSNNSTSGWGTYLSNITGNGTFVSSPILVSNLWGRNGIWGGDTIGLSYLGKNGTAVSWGYGVPITGGIVSQIYAAVITPAKTNGTAPAALRGYIAPTTGLVTLDGNLLAVSGGYFSASVAGNTTHFLNASAALYSSQSTKLYLKSGQILWYNFTLSPQNGTVLLSLTVDPPSANLTTGRSQILSAVVTCNAGACNGSVGFKWSLSNSLCILNTTVGHSVTLTSKNQPGSMLVNLTATLYSHSLTRLVNVTVRSSIPAPAFVRGHIAPASGAVTLDGTPVALQNGDFSATVAGNATHTLIGSAPLYVTQSAKVYATSEQTLWYNFTLSPVNGTILLSLSVNPPLASITTTKTQSFSATGSCNGGACIASLTYSWSINNSLAKLNATKGVTVTFIAGSQPGRVSITVTATMNRTSITKVANVSISAPTNQSPNPYGFLGSTYFYVTFVILAVVATALVIVFRRRRTMSRTPQVPPP